MVASVEMTYAEFHSRTDQSMSKVSIDNHQLQGLAIGTFGATARTQKGLVILIFHQYAYHGRGKSIHSSLQLEDNGVSVNDRPVSLNGTQSLITEDGYAIPLDFKNGLAYLNLRPFTEDEFENLPHVIRHVILSGHHQGMIPLLPPLICGSGRTLVHLLCTVTSISLVSTSRPTSPNPFLCPGRP